MKKILLTFLCLMPLGVAHAQIGYQGQNTISAGVAKTNSGYMGNVRYAHYLTNHTVLGGEVLYNAERLATTDNDHFNAQQVFGGFVYQYPMVFGHLGIFPSASVLCGGEFADKSTRNGNLLMFNSKFVFGFSVNMPIGVIIGQRVAIYADPRVLYLPNSSFERFIISIGAGVKCYF